MVGSMARKRVRQGHSLGGPPTFAHAPIAHQMAHTDGRSVGELLRDADHLARGLLFDLGASDAAPLLRSWPELVFAAHHAWSTIAVATTPDADAAGGPRRRVADPMATLREVAVGMRTTIPTSRWPGTGRTHPTLHLIADNFDRVAELVRRYGAHVPVHRDDVRDDAAAASARVIHTVYLVAHATQTALLEHGRRRHESGGRRRQGIPIATVGPPYAIGPTGRWISRISGCERIAARHLHRVDGGFAGRVAGEAPAPVEDPDRLVQALARWDIQSHRSMAARPAPHDVVLVARVQAFIAGSTLPVLDAAEQTGCLEPGADPSRTKAILDECGTAWNHVGRRWTDLARPAMALEPALAAAASEVRTAFRELTHGTAVRATPYDIAARADVRRVLAGIEPSMDSAADLAHVVHELSTNPALTGPARALSVRAHTDVEQQHQAGKLNEIRDVVWVSPQDVFANRDISLPPPVTVELIASSLDLINATRRACGVLGAGHEATRASEGQPGQKSLERNVSACSYRSDPRPCDDLPR